MKSWMFFILPSNLESLFCLKIYIVIKVAWNITRLQKLPKMNIHLFIYSVNADHQTMNEFPYFMQHRKQCSLLIVNSYFIIHYFRD